MTTTTKKSTSSSAKATTNSTVAENSVVKKENEALKQQIAEMQAQMKLLSEQIAMGASKKVEEKKQEKNIKFISLVPGILVLKGTQTWTIEGQFNYRTFIEREARMIVNNTKGAIQSGCVYIADADFIKENDLDAIYANLLNDEQLKNLLNRSFSEIVEVYKSVPQYQKDIIVRIIKDRKEAGIEVDANILTQIGKLCGQDLISEVEYEDEE